jgi:hypothetical protein
VDTHVSGGPAGDTGYRRPHQCGVGPDHAQQNDLNPWRQQHWVIPPQAHAALVWAMAAVLAVYTRPYDPQRPVVCLDEASKQLVADTRVPIPAAPGKLERSDDEYERQGTAHRFMVCEPLAGQRQVTVTDRRTAIDLAPVIQDVVDVYSPQADTIVLVMDHLNTHTPAAWYEAFEPAEARRLLERLEIDHTPKHGSWFNMAETALSVLVTQCLDRRLPDKEPLTREVAAWERQRHTAACRIDWQCTTQDARLKLKRLYPSIELG